MVFGVGGVAEGRDGETLPTNVTMLFEGEKRAFATQGTTSARWTNSAATHRIARGFARHLPCGGRGFCLGPATSLSRSERVFLTSFDFAGRVEFVDDDRHAPTRPALAPTPCVILSPPVLAATGFTRKSGRSKTSSHSRPASSKSRTEKVRHMFEVWLADTPTRQSQGLMFVRSLPTARGMLFVHPGRARSACG